MPRIACRMATVKHDAVSHQRRNSEPWQCLAQPRTIETTTVWIPSEQTGETTCGAQPGSRVSFPMPAPLKPRLHDELAASRSEYPNESSLSYEGIVRRLYINQPNSTMQTSVHHPNQHEDDPNTLSEPFGHGLGLLGQWPADDLGFIFDRCVFCFSSGNSC